MQKFRRVESWTRGQIDKEKYLKDFTTGFAGGATYGIPAAVATGGTSMLVGGLGGGAFMTGLNILNDVAYQMKSAENKILWQASDIKTEFNNISNFVEKIDAKQAANIRKLAQDYENNIINIVKKDSQSEVDKQTEPIAPITKQPLGPTTPVSPTITEDQAGQEGQGGASKYTPRETMPAYPNERIIEPIDFFLPGPSNQQNYNLYEQGWNVPTQYHTPYSINPFNYSYSYFNKNYKLLRYARAFDNNKYYKKADDIDNYITENIRLAQSRQELKKIIEYIVNWRGAKPEDLLGDLVQKFNFNNYNIESIIKQIENYQINPNIKNIKTIDQIRQFQKIAIDRLKKIGNILLPANSSIYFDPQLGAAKAIERITSLEEDLVNRYLRKEITKVEYDRTMKYIDALKIKFNISKENIKDTKLLKKILQLEKIKSNISLSTAAKGLRALKTLGVGIVAETATSYAWDAVSNYIRKDSIAIQHVKNIYESIKSINNIASNLPPDKKILLNLFNKQTTSILNKMTGRIS